MYLVFLGLVCLATLLGGLLPKGLVMHNPEVSACAGTVLEFGDRTPLGPALAALNAWPMGLRSLLGLPRHWDALVRASQAGSSKP